MSRYCLIGLVAVAGCTKQPATPQGGNTPQVGKKAEPETHGPDPSADLYADPPAGEEPIDPARAPVGTPLRPRRTDATFRLSRPRVEAGQLVVDCERVQPGPVQKLALMVRLPDGRAERGEPLAAAVGPITFRPRAADPLPKQAELYLVNTDDRYAGSFTFKVSNSVTLGDVTGKTVARNWTAVEGTALRDAPK